MGVVTQPVQASANATVRSMLSITSLSDCSYLQSSIDEKRGRSSIESNIAGAAVVQLLGPHAPLEHVHIATKWCSAMNLATKMSTLCG